jgi:hypothetical protein
MLDLGFSLVDLPDEDLEVVDVDLDKTISPSEFLAFVAEGLGFEEHAEKSLVPPPPPVDDLLFQSTDEEGLLTVIVHSGKDLRKPSTWLSKKSIAVAAVGAGEDLPAPDSVTTSRGVIKYDAEKASKYYDEKAAARAAPKLPSPPPSQPQRNAPASNVPTIPEGKEIDLSKLPPSPLKPGSTAKATDRDDVESLKSYKSVGGQYHHSAARLKALESLGADAGLKLHTDAVIKTAEASRTRSLGDLKRRHLESKDVATTSGLNFIFLNTTM